MPVVRGIVKITGREVEIKESMYIRANVEADIMDYIFGSSIGAEAKTEYVTEGIKVHVVREHVGEIWRKAVYTVDEVAITSIDNIPTKEAHLWNGIQQ